MQSLRSYWHALKAKMVKDPLPPEDVAAGWALGMFVGCCYLIFLRNSEGLRPVWFLNFDEK